MNKLFFIAVVFLVGHLFSSVALGQQKVGFEKEIWPILQKKCVECHKAPFEKDGKTTKPKAGLRLDGAWAIMLGGEGGSPIKPKDSAHSDLFIRVNLPEDDDDFMPPTGKADPLTPEEKVLLAKWIDEGADFGGWAGNLKGKPTELSNDGAKIPVSEIQELYKKLSEGLTPLKETAWKEVTASGGRVMPLSATSPLLAVDYRLTADDATDEKFKAVLALGTQIAHLDLSKTKISDAIFPEIAKMERLVRLDLHKTAVTDAAVGHLKGLKNLRYLNLYETQVSDTGLKDLESLKSLSAVYLWNSKATLEGVKQLEKALPEARINFK